MTIPYTLAILGLKFEVELPGEVVPVEINPGVQPGEEIRIEGKGAPYVGREGAGDLIVTVSVELPRNLTDEERTLVHKLERIRSTQSR